MRLVLQTPRLSLRELDADHAGDAEFIVELLNDSEWIRHIRDAGVRDVEQARSYIRTGPQAMVQRWGHGLWRVETRADQRALGLCGLIRRDGLDGPDLGFGFLPEARGQGLAQEAAQGVLDWATSHLDSPRVLAIVMPGNQPSLRLLARLGFEEQGMVRLDEAAPALKLLSRAR